MTDQEWIREKRRQEACSKANISCVEYEAIKKNVLDSDNIPSWLQL